MDEWKEESEEKVQEDLKTCETTVAKYKKGFSISWMLNLYICKERSNVTPPKVGALLSE